MTEDKLTVGSLFSGIGGFDLGFERAGMTVQWQAEIDKHARRVLARWWPAAHCYDDVKEIGGSAPRVDVLCGGFPCQDLSVAGRRAGLAGERSGLFHEFMRVVDEVAPRWVVIENVPGLLSSNDGRLDGQMKNQQKRCEAEGCGEWTQGFAEVDHASIFHLCDQHRTREVVAAIYGSVGDSFGSW